MPVRLVPSLVVVVYVLLLAGDSSGAPTAEQRTEINSISALLTKAGTFYKENKFKEAGEAVKEVQSRLEKVAEEADQATTNLLSPIHKRLVNAHALLELEGVPLPELKPLESSKPVAKPKGKAVAKGPPAATVSFVKDVVPVLNTRCGGCHVRNSRGMFSMSTYEVLMKGPMSAGPVIKGGDADNSLLIQKVADREMPPSGAGIPDAELATLKKWVEEGAKFDGPNPAAQLVSLLPAGAQAAAKTISVQPATGKETVSFAREIAPVIAQRCTGCHGNDNPRNDLNLLTIESLFRGGERGEPVLPGKPNDSLLVKKLKGTADGARMPQRGAPLDDATIAKFEKWIAEGARFDAPNPRQALAEVAAIAKAQSSTHEQLTADRAKLADDNWRLGMPGTVANKSESTNFLVLGNVGENTLADIAKRAEAMAPKVAEIFKAPRDRALVKGRVTLFVFGNHYDYSEFGRMVEGRMDTPSAWRGHHRFSVTDAYGAVLAPKADEYSLDALIAQQLAAVYIASLGKEVPHWFAEGCGRAVAARLSPASDRRVGQWDDELSSAGGALAAPDDFMKGKLHPEQADVLAFSFCKFLMADRRFPTLLDGLRNGGEFKTTFQAAFGASPEALTKLWVRNPPKVGRRR